MTGSIALAVLIISGSYSPAANRCRAETDIPDPTRNPVELSLFNFHFTVTDPLTRKPVPLEKYEGSNCYLMFVNPDLASSRAQIRTSERIREVYGVDLLNIVSIVFCRRPVKRLPLFLSTRPVSIPIFIADKWQQLAMGNIQIFPTNLLIDSRNRVIRRMEGYQSFDNLVPAIETLLEIKEKTIAEIQPVQVQVRTTE
ncbi:hypothetical protein JXA40_04940 [bacterium]|nr:hypothetical protein [candidate division CSSED10-310 bacterium]